VVVDPGVDHLTSGVAVAAFVGLLPLLLSLGREVMIAGVLVGITLDTAIKGLGSTLDLAYRSGSMPLLTVSVLAAVTVYLASAIPSPARIGPRWGAALSLIGLGPFLYVQYQVLQAPGWVSEMSGAPTGIVLVAITILNLAGPWAAQRLGDSRWAVGVSGVIVAAAMTVASGSGPVPAIMVALAIPAAAVVWVALIPDTRGTSVAAAAVGVTVGMVLFLMIGFAYYLPLDLNLGFSQGQARITGGVLVAFFALVAAVSRRGSVAATLAGTPRLVFPVLILPLVGLFGSQSLPEPSVDGPVRYMAYNIHQGFGTAGDMDIEVIAMVIKDSGATVVGLQEVARAGLLNANADLVYLLADRLGWEHAVFFGTTDPVWGNAILSRYPLSNVERRLLPKVGTPYQRGYLAASVATPEGEVLFISTHLQHINDPDFHREDPESDLYPVHHEQLGVVLDQWDGRSPAVLVGDLNARPEWRQVMEFLDAGWVDAWTEAGTGSGFTANAADPRYRIDYVFHTTDMSAVNAEVIDSQASDHFAVVADLTRG